MYTYKANVLRVVDGDTVIVDIDLGFGVWLRGQTIRLAKINAPELRGASLEAGRDSKTYLSKLVLDKRVMIRTEKDRKEKYGRWLAVILLEEDKNLIDINHKMVAEGHAVIYK
jgi:micrococcal nuclease